MYENFQALVAAAKAQTGKRVAAVAEATDEMVIRSVRMAKQEQLADSILIGDAEKIRSLLLAELADPADFEIIHADNPEESAQTAVDLIREERASFLVKGSLNTSTLLRAVVKRDNGLRTGRIMSHLSFNQLPGYHKLLLNTDAGMIVHPSLEDKKHIIQNAVETLRCMGYDMPKVAVLAGIETVDPKIIETVEADLLKQMNRTGVISDCYVEGPLSYDVAMSAEIARHKHVDCPYSGDFDVLVQPNLASGNIMNKAWILNAGATMAGLVVGAKVPVVVVSRGASAEEKYLSFALAALASASGMMQ